MKKIIIISIISSLLIIGLVFAIKHYELVSLSKIDTYGHIEIKPADFYHEAYIGPRTIIKTVKIWDYTEPRASQIMYDFAYKYLVRKLSDDPEELKRNLKQLEESGYYGARAFEFDLDDDGVNEVIGVPPFASLFLAPKGAQFFILKKQGNEYVEIENKMIYLYTKQRKIVIFKEKTNGYHHMQFRITDLSEPKHLIKYNSNRGYFGIYFYEYLKKNKK